MTVPVTPPLLWPRKTPKWLIQAVALAAAVVPMLLAWWQPGGTFDTPGSQAAIVLVGLIVAALIFAATVVVENVAHYGMSKAALTATVSDAEAELRQLLPEARTLFATAKPLVDQLGGANDLIAGLQSTVTDVQAKLDQIPSGQAALDALQSLWNIAASTVPNTQTVTPPPPPPPASILGTGPIEAPPTPTG